jgi:hypothetical protein
MKSKMLRSKWVMTAAVIAALGTASACNVRDELLSPQQPGTILPGDIASAGVAGAEALRVGALGRFQQLTPGGGNGNQTEATLLGDLLADVWKSGDTFTQHNETDQRTISTNNSVLSTAYSDLTRSRGFYRDAIKAIREVEPDKSAEIAEQYFIMGYSEMLLAELFCNGAPLGETVNGVFTPFGEQKTNQEVYGIALTHLDSALTLAVTVAGNTHADTLLAASIKNAASVAKGRVLVDMANFTDAATAVANVPTAYTYNVTFSQQTNDNNIWGLAGQISTRARFVVSDSFDTQGTLKNALPFASAHDPRVPAEGSPLPDLNPLRTFDGTTPLVFQKIWLNRSDPIPVATGVDARLIEAEAKLQAQDIPGMMAILNDLRTKPQKLGPLDVPAMAALPAELAPTDSAAVSLFFREKAFWQFGRGMRLGDARRLIRQYGRLESDVLPTGKFHKAGGASYGTDVNLPVTDNERTNPNFAGCIDRKA